LAAKAAVNYFEHQTPLSSYEASWKEQIGLEMENSKLMRQASDRVMAHGFLFDTMLRMMGTKRISDVIMCQIPRGMGRFMRLLA
jgi:flavin-dependent dehydrogenase